MSGKRKTNFFRVETEGNWSSETPLRRKRACHSTLVSSPCACCVVVADHGVVVWQVSSRPYSYGLGVTGSVRLESI